MDICSFDFKFLFFFIPIALLGVYEFNEAVKRRGLRDVLRETLEGTVTTVIILLSAAGFFYGSIALFDWLDCMTR